MKQAVIAKFVNELTVTNIQIGRKQMLYNEKYDIIFQKKVDIKNILTEVYQSQMNGLKIN